MILIQIKNGKNKPFYRFISTISKLPTTKDGHRTKATPPAAEGFMQGLEKSKLLCLTREQTLSNQELLAAGIKKDGTYSI